MAEDNAIISQDFVTTLIVDDDEGHRELVRRSLARAGVHKYIDAVTNGDDALDYVFFRGAWENRSPHGKLLILLDINMPGGSDGIEVLRQIKSDPRTESILIIMLTTTDDPRAIKRSYELGCDNYVTKPIKPADFLKAITRLGLLNLMVA